MAVRASTFNRTYAKGVTTVTWAGLTNATTDSGDPISLPECGEMTFQVIGTLGAAGAVTLEGSNDGGTTYATLKDKQGTAMVASALGFYATQSRPISVRPRVTAGDGTTSLTVVVACHRTDLSQLG